MDRLTEMEAFATVVDQGGFTDAARKLGMSKSAVSKHVSALEGRLGAKLLHRTTRRVAPTEVGLAYYDRARRVLHDAREADSLVGQIKAAPSGLLRLAVMTDFGVHVLSPLLSDFLSRYTELSVDMVLTNRHVDVTSERYDVAIRTGDVPDGNLHVSKLTETCRRIVAAPDYLQTRERPARIEDLSAHRLLHFSDRGGAGAVWHITAPSGERREVRTGGGLAVNDSRLLLQAAISGAGIAQLPDFMVAEALKTGQLEEVMPHLPRDMAAIHAVYPPAHGLRPNLRAFLAFLAEHFRMSGPEHRAITA